MTKTRYADIVVQPEWYEELKKAKKYIRRLDKRYGLEGWKTGGCYTDRVKQRWNEYYNSSYDPQHRHIIYRGIDNNDFAIWLETKLIQWSQDRGTGVKQDRIAVLNTTEYPANRTGCVYMVAIN